MFRWSGVLLILPLILHGSALQCSPGVVKQIQVNWFAGSLDCSQPGAKSPAIQVYQYDNSTYIMRQHRCIHYEAPFMYLLFGANSVFLLDTGASLVIDVRGTVEGIISTWLQSYGRSRESLQLIVAHSHSHEDHTTGDDQFLGQPNTTVVGLSASDVAAFFNLQNWPNQDATLDLGNRLLGILPIPGHEDASIAVYDCKNGILLTGDTLMAGRLYIPKWQDNYDSINRLAKYVSQLPVNYILGAHIEMSDQAGIDYPRGEQYLPHEHKLELSLKDLGELQAALNRLGRDNPTYEVHNNWIIYPTDLPLPQGQRVSEHGMVVLNHETAIPSGSNPIYMSFNHVPMFRAPHDFQFAFSTWVGRDQLPAQFPAGEMTIVPEDFSLNDLIEGRLSNFTADLYNGSAEHGGNKIGSFTASPAVNSVSVASHLDANASMALSTLRYYVINDCVNPSEHTTGNGNGNSNDDTFICSLVHHIVQQPDFDHVITFSVRTSDCQSGLLHGDTNAYASSSTNAAGLTKNNANKLSVPPFVRFNSKADATTATTAKARSKTGGRHVNFSRQGQEMVFFGRNNDISARLKPGEQVTGYTLGDIYNTKCAITILSDYSCLKGPDFFDLCD